MMSVRKEIIKDVSIFSGSTLLAKIILAIRGIITAKFLGPAMYGLWNALSIIFTYAGQAHLGTLNALQKEVPYYRAKGENSRADEISNTVLSFEIVSGAVIGIVIFIISFFIQASAAVIIGLRVVSVIVLLQLVEYFYYTLLRTEKKFVILSKLTVLYAVVAVVLITPLVIFYNIYGLFVVVLMMPVLLILVYRRQTDFRFRFVFKSNEIKRLLGIGFPILGMILLYGFFRGIDKIMIIGLLGKVDLGYYSIAVMVSNVLFLAPRSVADSISPRMFGKLGETENIKDITVYLIKPTIVQAYLIPVLTGLAIIAAEVVLRIFLAEYLVSYKLIVILAFGTFFMSVPMLAWSYIVAINKQRNILPLFVAAIVLSISLNYLFISLGMGVSGVAIATAISYFFYGTSVMGYCSYFCFKNIKQISGFFVTIYAPVCYIMAVVVSLNRLFAKSVIMQDSVILCAILKTLILLVASAPLFIIVDKKFGVFSLFVGPFKNYFRSSRKK